jgi:DNA primase
MFFQQDTISHILDKINVSILVRQETGIKMHKKCKATYYETCPLCGSHNSFTTTESGFNCFACGTGGNAIAFIMKYRNKTFAETVKYLADKQGILVQLPEANKVSSCRKLNTLFKINNMATGYYMFECINNPEAIEYCNSRGLDDKLRKTMKIGYAGPKGDKLYQYLKNKGFSDSDILESGLCARNVKGTLDTDFYDKFFNRIIFPIFNKNNEIIGFGGRNIDNNPYAPKYLNSQETQVFNKGKNLFLYNEAQNSKLPYYIVCEGYMDAISLHNYGFDSAVASLGTALTKDQIKLLSQKKIILAYDSDDAGIKATLRAINICRELGVTVNVLKIEGAKDPDEFLRKYGTTKFKQLLKKVEEPSRFIIQNVRIDEKFDFESAVEELLRR